MDDLFCFVFQGAVESKILMVICTKTHKTRYAYEQPDGTLLNCCPGVCVDAKGGAGSIASIVKQPRQ